MDGIEDSAGVESGAGIGEGEALDAYSQVVSGVCGWSGPTRCRTSPWCARTA